MSASCDTIILCLESAVNYKVFECGFRTSNQEQVNLI